MQIIKHDVNRKTYFGLLKSFVSWEYLAEQAVKLYNPKSKISVTDKGYSEQPVLFDVNDIKKDFGLEFDPRGKI
jgi:UDP-glucose 4-epimerase